MIPAEVVVAVACDDERGHGLHSARNQTENVERGLVGPMQVFQNQHARSCSELAQQAHPYFEGPSAARNEIAQLAPRLLRDVVHGAQRAGREQRVAGAPKESWPGRVSVTEGTQESRLSDSRLAGDEDHAAVAPRPDRLELALELRELARSLQKLVRSVGVRFGVRSRHAACDHGPRSMRVAQGPWLSVCEALELYGVPRLPGAAAGRPSRPSLTC